MMTEYVSKIILPRYAWLKVALFIKIGIVLLSAQLYFFGAMAHAQLTENTNTSVVELKAHSGAGWVNDSVSFYLETDEPVDVDKIISLPNSSVSKPKHLNLAILIKASG